MCIFYFDEYAESMNTTMHSTLSCTIFCHGKEKFTTSRSIHIFFNSNQYMQTRIFHFKSENYVHQKHSFNLCTSKLKDPLFLMKNKQTRKARFSYFRVLPQREKSGNIPIDRDRTVRY